MARIYAHYHNPEAYPEFEKRPIRVTTRAALENEIQFMSLRALPHTDDGTLLEIKEALDLYTKRFDLGKVFWMRSNIVTAPNLSDFLDEVVKRDGYVFDLWGFVPGSYKAGLDWGEYTVSEETHKLFINKLGDHFVGYDNGEQDGRYIGSYARTECPARQSDGYQQRRFYEFFDAMGAQLKHATTALCSLNYCHFFARENNCYMLGAETAQALPNANLWYAYLRGAGKQYGLLWFGNASVYNRFSWKSYEREGIRLDVEGYTYGPTVGTSLSLLRRLMYIEYLYNSDMLGYESGLLTLKENMDRIARGEALDPLNFGGDKKNINTADDVVLSPIGQLQSDCIQFVKQRGAAGVMYTPIAIILSSGNGWTMPRSLYAPEVYRTWGEIPYRECDHHLHSLMSMIYPGYEDSGFFLNERGFLTPTPYGEQMDVIMSDMRPETLWQYNVALLAGWQALDGEQVDKLSTFVSRGGTLVAFASQLEGCEAANELFGINSLGTRKHYADTLITYEGVQRREADFTGYTDVIIADAHPIAYLENGAPFILERESGAGRTLLVLSPYGMDQRRNTAPMHNDENKSIPLMYDMLSTVKALLSDVFNAQQLVSVSNPSLEYIVNIRDEHTLTVTVINNSYTAEYYGIELHCGKEISRREIELPDLDYKTAGYYPPYVIPKPPFAHIGDPGVDRLPGAERPHVRDMRLALWPGQMAMWEFKYEPCDVDFAPEIEMHDMSRNFYASLRPQGILINELLAMPMLDKYFAGIKLDADYVNDISLAQAEQCGSWLKRRHLDVIVDFTSLLDHYPHMSLIRNMPWKLERNMAWMENIIAKSAALGASRIILSTHRNAENHLTSEEALSDMRATISELRDMAANHGIGAIIENGVPRALNADVNALARTFPDMPLAINISHCLLRGDMPNAETLCSARGLLISAPLRDEVNQLCDAHIPVRTSGYRAAINELLASVDLKQYEFICLDGVYDSFEELYFERRDLIQ